ncbi:MAG: type II toxin-antitoxin system RelE/ParE family toxin [Desulfococcus multivorans]|jgi:mRNA-degrading endonuclease RelE of RelBE toxin-antitoxin system|nr:type II toxin-antitoxin system RelE/ParE family toxin [Desulfococcus multivorans]
MSGYRLVYSETCRSQIMKLHPAIKPVVRECLDRLCEDPFAGKMLERELSGYCSLHAKRFRIIYRLNEDEMSIEIHYVGHRKDIYELFTEKVTHGKKSAGL